MVTNRLVCAAAVLLALIAGCRNGDSTQPATSGDVGQSPAKRVAAETDRDQSSAVVVRKGAVPPMSWAW